MRNTSKIDKVFIEERDSLFRFAYGMLGNKDDALDILHDSYEKVKKKGSNTQILNPKGYLFLTVRNHCFDLIEKKKKRLVHRTEPNELSINDNGLDIKDELMLVVKFLEQLPPKQRSVIILKDIEGYNYDEVSRMLNTDKNGIRVNLSIARKKVRNAFEALREKELEKRR